MKYLKVDWRHQSNSYPTLIFSEIDDSRMESRKIEWFRDGSVAAASSSTDSGRTRLGIVPLPSLEEINEDPQFHAEEISQELFEQEWKAHISKEREKRN